MRTTLTLEDTIAEALKKRAYETDRSFKEVVNETLRAGLEQSRDLPSPRRYRLKPASLGTPRANIDLDKALQLAGTLEDEELGHKMDLRK